VSKISSQIQPERLLYDAERDLSAIAEFPVHCWVMTCEMTFSEDEDDVYDDDDDDSTTSKQSQISNWFCVQPRTIGLNRM